MAWDSICIPLANAGRELLSKNFKNQTKPKNLVDILMFSEVIIR